MTHRFGFALVLSALLAACGDNGETATPTATIDTLPNGALLVQNAAQGAWDSAAAWRFVEETRIGSMEGDGPDVFGDVRDIEVDPLGRVWILDPQSKSIRVFEADGDFVRTVGRGGAGPGELEEPNGIEFDAQGRLWVQDPRNARFTVFDTTGAFVTSHRRESTMYSWIWPGGITADGRVFDIDIRRTGPGQGSGQVLLERDSLGAAIDTFDLPAFEPELYTFSSDGLTMNTLVPFSPYLEWRIADDGTMWFGTTDDYRLIHRSLEGDTIAVVEKEWTPVPVTAVERDSALGGDFIEQLRQRGAEVDPGRIPANRPAWSEFWIDDAGYLWVRAHQPANEPVTADVFRPDGVYLGSVELLPRMPIEPLIRGDRVYAIVLDELDVSHVVIGRLDGRETTGGGR